MVDHPQRALDIFLEKKRAEEREVRRQKEADDELLVRHLEHWAPQLSAALAKVLEADSETEEFTSLTWEYAKPVKVQGEQGKLYVVPQGPERDVEYRTDFQGINVHGKALSGHFVFFWQNEAGSSLHGFRDLLSFGSAVASARGLRAPYLEDEGPAAE